MAAYPEEERDFVTIGRRIREQRQKFGLSAAELATRANVAKYTVLRVEQGKPANNSTIEKIRSALHLFTDQMTRPYADGPFAIHRAAETRWNVAVKVENYQKQTTDDDRIHVNDEAERRRLGNLGFQPFFTAILESELHGNVSSHALMEFHQASWVDRHFGEEFIYCLRGSMTITVDGKPCVLNEGDAMSFDATNPHQYIPTEKLKPTDPAPLLLIVVSKRPGEQMPKRKPRPGAAKPKK